MAAAAWTPPHATRHYQATIFASPKFLPEAVKAAQELWRRGFSARVMDISGLRGLWREQCAAWAQESERWVLAAEEDAEALIQEIRHLARPRTPAVSAKPADSWEAIIETCLRNLDERPSGPYPAELAGG
ncbi:MAG: hypothetical protein HY549_04335 [Elusimicrobia bacterium]|nr:hypothetical protein [Elusimicrobiota bacterium]